MYYFIDYRVHLKFGAKWEAKKKAKHAADGASHTGSVEDDDMVRVIVCVCVRVDPPPRPAGAFRLPLPRQSRRRRESSLSRSHCCLHGIRESMVAFYHFRIPLTALRFHAAALILLLIRHRH